MRIIAFGDRTSGFQQVRSDNVDVAVLAKTPDYIAGVGDWSNTGKLIGTLMTNYAAYQAAGTIYSSWGNHELDADVTGADFKNYLGWSKSYNSIRMGIVEFFFYDNWLKMDESGWYTTAQEGVSNALSVATRKASIQGQWLINGLANSTAKFKILCLHSPIWGSEDAGYLCNGMRWDWAAYRVDMILQGHRHHYERMAKPTGSGIVPVVTNAISGLLPQANHKIPGDPDSVVQYNVNINVAFADGCYLIMDVDNAREEIRCNLHSVSGVNDVGDWDVFTLKYISNSLTVNQDNTQLEAELTDSQTLTAEL